MADALLSWVYFIGPKSVILWISMKFLNNTMCRWKKKLKIDVNEQKNYKGFVSEHSREKSTK